MVEPPVQADSDGAALAPRKTGHNLLDLTIAAVAIVISLISLGVAVQNSLIQQKVLTASTWPIVQFQVSNILDENQNPRRGVKLSLRNAGVGPAKVESVRMFWRGKRYVSVIDFLKDCCAAKAPGGHYGNSLMTSTVSPNIILPGQTIAFFTLPRQPGEDRVFDVLDGTASQIKIEICYCSVFNECWKTDGDKLEPPRVKQCPKDPPFPS